MTTVEFISKGLFDILQEAEDNNIFEIGTQNFKRYVEMFENQAKELEKQQIIEFTNDFIDKHTFGDYDGIVQKNKSVKKYYNETFKNK